MEELEGYMNFWPDYNLNTEIQDQDYCFIYRKKRIIAKVTTENIEIPRYQEVKKWVDEPQRLWYLGKWKEKSCFAYPYIEQHNTPCTKNEEQHQSLEWVGYRDVRWNLDLEQYFIAIKVQQLLDWDQSTTFCGYCGQPYYRKEDERAKICKNCGSIQYPRISPAIIVGIKKGEQILLAHNSGFREGFYSVIAGFVEQGETLENAVKREIYEEVGIKVKNIQYFQSRPWISFDSLMIGFIAEYESGEIKVDGKEIVDADWYDKTHLPPMLPDKISTAWWIINEILGLEG